MKIYCMMSMVSQVKTGKINSNFILIYVLIEAKSTWQVIDIPLTHSFQNSTETMASKVVDSL